MDQYVIFRLMMKSNHKKFLYNSVISGISGSILTY